MESTEMISPPSFSASSRAISDLPTAVGPARKTGRRWKMEDGRCFPAAVAIFDLLSPIPCPQSRTRQDPQQKHPRRENREADHVSGGEPPAEKALVLGVITAEDFHERPEHSIADQIGGEDLAIKFLAAVQPGQRTI